MAAFEIGKDGLGAIVLGYDGSEPARSALAFAAGIARRERSLLHVCIVSTLPALSAASPEAAGPITTAQADSAHKLADEIRPALEGLGVGFQMVIRNGDPARELEQLADEVHADLLVVGRSHGRAHAVVGSVAVHLVRHAGCPVLVVP